MMPESKKNPHPNHIFVFTNEEKNSILIIVMIIVGLLCSLALFIGSLIDFHFSGQGIIVLILSFLVSLICIFVLGSQLGFVFSHNHYTLTEKSFQIEYHERTFGKGKKDIQTLAYSEIKIILFVSIRKKDETRKILKIYVIPNKGPAIDFPSPTDNKIDKKNQELSSNAIDFLIRSKKINHAYINPYDSLRPYLDLSD